MKKIIGTTVAIVALSLAFAGTTHAQFTIENLTNSALGEDHPRINPSGQAVWSKTGEIFFYDGSTITQITATTFGNQEPEIDDSGNVAWRGTLTPGGDSEGSTQEIFFWDGSSITQLTNNSYSDRLPRISNGKVVWEGMGFGGTDSEIFLFDGSSVTQLTNNSFNDSDPRISGNGDVFWVGEAGGPNQAGKEIFRFDGNSITQLTNNAYEDTGLRLNNVGHAVWTGNNEIFLFDGNSVSQITTTSSENTQPDINDSGQIAWSGVPSGGSNTLLFFDGTSTIEVTNSNSITELRINNGGSIVWKTFSGALQEIFHFDGTSVTNLSNGFANNCCNKDPEISNNGQVIWLGVPLSGVNYDVFLASPLTAVAIDINPKKFPNRINLKKGNIKVAILTTGTFDAATVDATTVLFGRTGIEASPTKASLKDVDRDGLIDMLLSFNGSTTGIQCGDTQAVLTGETNAGAPFEGFDSIITVGCK